MERGQLSNLPASLVSGAPGLVGTQGARNKRRVLPSGCLQRFRAKRVKGIRALGLCEGVRRKNSFLQRGRLFCSPPQTLSTLSQQCPEVGPGSRFGSTI